jgi:N-acetyl sugar amidotransferase
MKIGIFVPNFTVNKEGHVPVFFQTRVDGYIKSGHQVEIITHSFNLEAQLENKNLTITVIKKKEIYEYLRRTINDREILFIHFINFRIIRFLLNYNINATVIFHGVEAISAKRYRFDWKLKPFFFFKKYIYNLIQFYFLKKIINKKKNIKFIFVSNWMKRSIEEDLGVNFSKSQCSIIHNPVDRKFTDANFKLINSRSKINIIVVKNFDSYKYGGDLTIKFILKFSKNKLFDNFNFTIIGRGVILEKYKKKLSNYKNINLINKFIKNKELINLYKENDIFLYLTRLDAQSVSISEALSTGMVVVSSNIAAIPEFIKDSYNGYLIENNYESFKSKFEYIYQNKNNLEIISQNAKKFSIEKFDSIINSKKEILFASQKIICKSCLVDNSISEVYFNDKGICSYCLEFIPYLESLKKENTNTNRIEETIIEIKKSSINRKYDSLIGISGGVDSSYVVHLAKEYKLNPLLVHFDNGWNSELASSNINNLIKKTNFDLKTIVVNWEEFRDIQLSFLKAGVIDIELVSDHAIFANLLDIASKYKIKNILSGTNIMTEHAMPGDWMWRKTDFRNIKNIHKSEGSGQIKTYPHMNFLKWYLNLYVFKKYNIIEILNKINYSKKEAIRILQEKYNWKTYKEKHYESVFTKFYQSYILPNKFNIDKRIIHYSSLIRNKELSRIEALKLIGKGELDDNEIRKDKKYIAKKLNFSIEQFDKIISKNNIKSHYDYKNSEFFFQILKKLFYLTR